MFVSLIFLSLFYHIKKKVTYPGCFTRVAIGKTSDKADVSEDMLRGAKEKLE